MAGENSLARGSSYRYGRKWRGAVHVLGGPACSRAREWWGVGGGPRAVGRLTHSVNRWPDEARPGSRGPGESYLAIQAAVSFSPEGGVETGGVEEEGGRSQPRGSACAPRGLCGLGSALSAWPADPCEAVGRLAPSGGNPVWDMRAQLLKERG